jgi:fumarylpyruvate hydrolase
MTTTYLWTPPPVYSLPVRGKTERLPVHRLFFVGRNYHAHAVEMGKPVDKASERPFYFTKAPSTLVESGATVAYPPETKNFHHEMELVVAIGAAGFRVADNDAAALVYGYACGAGHDPPRPAARGTRQRPAVGPGQGRRAVLRGVGDRADAGVLLAEGELVMTVNGQPRQQSDLKMLIWNVRELIVDLSKFYHLQPGDLIFTGTPEGVGAVEVGDRIDGHINGVGEITLHIGAPE